MQSACRGFLTVIAFVSILLLTGCGSGGQHVYPAQLKVTMQALKENSSGGIMPIVICDPGDMRSIDDKTLEACNIYGSGWKQVMVCAGGVQWENDHYLCKP